MKPYRAFFRANGQPPSLVKAALSKRVLLLGWVGLFLHGAWVSALLAGATSLLAGAFLPGSVALSLQLAAHLGLAAFTPEIRAWELRLNGAVPGPIVMGRNRTDALLRLIDRNPTIISPAPTPDLSRLVA